MTEHELKFSADKSSTENLREILVNNKDIEKIQRGVQINFYYDDKEQSFYKSGTTIRIRQKETGLALQIKKKNFYGEHKNFEDSQKIDSIPKSLIIENKTVFLQGSLTTDRTRHTFKNGVRVDIDVNFYNGISDYEVEIELPENFDKTEDDVIRQMTERFDLISGNKGKITRFLSSIE